MQPGRGAGLRFKCEASAWPRSPPDLAPPILWRPCFPLLHTAASDLHWVPQGAVPLPLPGLCPAVPRAPLPPCQDSPSPSDLSGHLLRAVSQPLSRWQPRRPALWGFGGGHVFPSRQSPGWLFTQEAGVSEPREGRDHGAWVLSHSRAGQAGCSDVQVEWMRVAHRSQCVAVVPNSKVSRLSLEPPALTLCPPPRVSHPPL